MSIKFDKDKAVDMFETPELNKPVRIRIGQCEETISGAGNSMIILNCEVTQNQTGDGFKSKFYLVEGRMFNYNCKRIMEACGMDIDAVQEVDDMTFRDRFAVVTFKEEKYQKDGETKTATKIDRWIPAESIEAAEAPVVESKPTYPEDDIPF